MNEDQKKVYNRIVELLQDCELVSFSNPRFTKYYDFIYEQPAGFFGRIERRDFSIHTEKIKNGTKEVTIWFQDNVIFREKFQLNNTLLQLLRGHETERNDKIKSSEEMKLQAHIDLFMEATE